MLHFSTHILGSSAHLSKGQGQELSVADPGAPDDRPLPLLKLVEKKDVHHTGLQVWQVLAPTSHKFFDPLLISIYYASYSEIHFQEGNLVPHNFKNITTYNNTLQNQYLQNA